MSSLESSREHGEVALNLRDVHDTALAARNHASSARALIHDDNLGLARLDAAISTLDALLDDLHWGGLPA
jgi:hypothetical protein